MRNLILVLLVFFCSLGRGQSANEAVPQIQVTRTWGDLLKTKPLTVECDNVILPGAQKPEPGKFGDAPKTKPGKSTPVQVWVGIDRDHSTRYGGVVLYCLAKGVSFAPASSWGVGPFEVRVHAAHVPFVVMSSAVISQKYSYGDSSYLLFTKAIPFGVEGDYTVDLFPSLSKASVEQSRSVASLHVKVAGAPVLPWSPWGGSKKAALRWQHGGNIPGMTETYTTVTVSNPVGNIAVPVSGSAILDHAPSSDTPLPQLIPDQPDPGTHLKMEGNNLIVTMNHELEIYYPDDHFLTRWWVNDKPYMPDPNAVDADAPKGRSLAARVWNVKEVRFELDFRPERLGAKKGDRIGVQVLFCPLGWGLSDGMHEGGTPLLGPIPAFPTSFSFPSNRIDFIYSGNPANLQQK